jgi:hypothetical protein
VNEAGTLKLSIRRPHILRAAAVILMAVVLTMTTPAASVENYKTRIDSARAAVDSLLLNDDGPDAEAAREIFATIRENIPASERVEWPGGSVETDNTWLGEALTKYESAEADNERAAALAEISERLAGISLLVEDRLAPPGPQAKDAEKQKLNEILSREEYKRPEAEGESLFQRLYREFMEWLRRLMPESTATEPGTPTDFNFIRILLQVAIFTAAAALLAFLAFRLFPALRGRFASGGDTEREDRIIFGERLADDETAGDLFREAERLAAEGDLRAAIRKGYIALLCDLSEKRVLRLSRHKTNRDYLRDTRRHVDLHPRVQRLTDAFELNWYGRRPAAEADWDTFRNEYREAIATARGK